MNRPLAFSFPGANSRAALLASAVLSLAPVRAAAPLVVGDPVRATHSEMLGFQGKNFGRAAKGQEFTLLKIDAVRKQVFVSFLRDDGTLIALTLPAAAVEAAPPHAALDLVRGAEAFREQRYDEAKRLLARAAQDPSSAALAGALLTRMNGALAAVSQTRANPAMKQAATTALQMLRDTAEQLAQVGRPSLALPLDEGADSLGAQAPGLTLPATKVDRADLAKRSAISHRAFLLARQAFALKHLVAAAKQVRAGLEAEPAQPELKMMQPLVEKDLEEADSLCKTAKKMQRQPNGAVHALSAIDDGLKLCTDHAELLGLRKELASAFEERTSPPVTPAFVSLARVSTPTPGLEQGRKLYTSRCTECHDLEMLDARSLSAWERMVASMGRRANLSEADKTRIMEYIAAAQKVVEAGGVK